MIINKDTLKEKQYKDMSLDEIIIKKYELAQNDPLVNKRELILEDIVLEDTETEEDIVLRDYSIFDFKTVTFRNCKINKNIYVNSKELNFYNADISYIQIEDNINMNFWNEVNIKELIIFNSAPMLSVLTSSTKVNIEYIDAYNVKFRTQSDATSTSVFNGVHISGMNHNLYNACPTEGSFIGYKKVKTADGEEVICKLLILKDAKRSSGLSRKCRASKVKVLDIYNILDKNIKYKKGYSCIYNKCDQCRIKHGFDEEIHEKLCSKCTYKDEKITDKFCYTIGNIIEIKDFDENRWNECTTGIHFYPSETEAINV